MNDLPPDGDDPWTIRETTPVLDNPWLRVESHDARHRLGRETVYTLIRMKKRAVGVLPLFDDGRVALVGQWRLPHGRYSWEIPEGGAETGEPADGAARRELAEETGLEARTLLPIVESDLSNMLTDEKASLFLAHDLTQGSATPEDSEELARAEPRFADVVAAILDGRIRDSMTILAVFTVEAKARRGRWPEPVIRSLRAGGAAV